MPCFSCPTQTDKMCTAIYMSQLCFPQASMIGHGGEAQL